MCLFSNKTNMLESSILSWHSLSLSTGGRCFRKYWQCIIFYYICIFDRHMVLGMDVSLFLLKTIGWYDELINQLKLNWAHAADTDAEPLKLSIFYSKASMCASLTAHTLHDLSGIFGHFIFRSGKKDKKADTSLFREVAGDVVLVTGAGHGMGRWMWWRF